jgi:branched-chain amino acid transport system ATP-binding protein
VSDDTVIIHADDVVGQEPEALDASTPAPGPWSGSLLEVSDLRSGYGDIQVLHGLTFDVRPGEIVALMGSNGAGKTTTLKTIVGLLRAAGGRITYDSDDVTKATPEVLVPRGVVLCPEGRGMLKDMTVRQNLELGAYVTEDQRTVEERLEQAFDAYPILFERQGQLAGTLSGGQQQMLAIVRAMMSGPRLLLIDEASLGLSPVMAEDTFALIQRVNREQGTAVLLVEQNVLALDLAHRAFVIETGRIVQRAEGDELEDLKETLREVYLGKGH